MRVLGVEHPVRGDLGLVGADDRDVQLGLVREVTHLDQLVDQVPADGLEADHYDVDWGLDVRRHRRPAPVAPWRVRLDAEPGGGLLVFDEIDGEVGVAGPGLRTEVRVEERL